MGRCGVAGRGSDHGQDGAGAVRGDHALGPRGALVDPEAPGRNCQLRRKVRVAARRERRRLQRARAARGRRLALSQRNQRAHLRRRAKHLKQGRA